MVPSGTDASFPQCCARCPHIEPETAACTHSHRQALLSDLDAEEPCPVYTTEKSAAMDRLARTLRSRRL